MKRTIALSVLLLSFGCITAQTPDSVPPSNMPGKWSLDSNSKRWNNDTVPVNQKQDPPANKQIDTARDKKPVVEEKLTDRVAMKNGEMQVIKNGEVNKMATDIVLPSGTIIKTDGTVKKKDGTEVKLKDGQYIELPASEKSKPE